MTELTTNPYAMLDESPDPEVPTATLQIYDGIAERLGRKEIDTQIDRASSATMCVRRRWYQGQGLPGKQLTPRKLINFMMGDIAEKVLVHQIEASLVGPGKLYSEVNFGEEVGSFDLNGKTIKVYKQKTFHWRINDQITVTAHVDGLGRRNLDGKWELIEIKSASEYGFEEFKESGPGDYIKQAHACMMTADLQLLDVHQVRFFYLLKTTGHLFDRVLDFNPAIAKEVEAGFIAARAKDIPERPHAPVEETFRSKPTGRHVLPWQCGYCSHLETCWPHAVKEFKNGQFGTKKPVFMIPEEK